ncbi:MAG: flagellar basal body-associated FliL family protein [Phenylobacterium sp.]|uniref:flagellar basal body-associated FliL family protein n=1 Tax=Phenylobacterium sp. TaxID=1871053 RepID=UPI0030167419
MAKPPKKSEPEEVDLEGAEGAEGAEKPAGGKKLPLRLILIAAAALLVLVGGGVGAYFMFFKKPPAAEGKAEGKGEKKGEKGEKGKKKEGEKKEGEKKEGAAGTGVVVTEGPDGVFFCTLPNMVANMQAADGRPTYLKLKITLEAPNQEAADMIQPALPRIQDMFQGFLRELRPEDLQGSQGTFQLRREVLRRINLVIAPARVNSVLIEEMLIS